MLFKLWSANTLFTYIQFLPKNNRHLVKSFRMTQKRKKSLAESQSTVCNVIMIYCLKGLSIYLFISIPTKVCKTNISLQKGDASIISQCCGDADTGMSTFPGRHFSKLEIVEESCQKEAGKKWGDPVPAGLAYNPTPDMGRVVRFVNFIILLESTSVTGFAGNFLKIFVLASQNNMVFPCPGLRGGKPILMGTFFNKMFWAESLSSAEAGDGSDNTMVIPSLPYFLRCNYKKVLKSDGRSFILKETRRRRRGWILYSAIPST